MESQQLWKLPRRRCRNTGRLQEAQPQRPTLMRESSRKACSTLNLADDLDWRKLRRDSCVGQRISTSTRPYAKFADLRFAVLPLHAPVACAQRLSSTEKDRPASCDFAIQADPGAQI